MLESLNISFLTRRPFAALVVGFVYTIIGYLVASFFFEAFVSIPMLFLSTLLIIPSLMKLLSIEEKRERKYGLKHFFLMHKDVTEIYLFLFLGVFLGYLLLGMLIPQGPFQNVFAYQLDYLAEKQSFDAETLQKFFQEPFQPSFQHLLGLLETDLEVAIVFFLLSFFYGAGAVFLLILNASIFASFLAAVIRYLAKDLSMSFIILSFFSIHVIPEVLGFLLAAIAGGVVSKAMLHEEFMSTPFRNVLRDAAILLIIACCLIIIGNALEVYVTPKLFQAYF
ncbi:stage II sporulation protein M [Candidatus Woesearchaeota archaeon]|nr:stage II sporulation protein M [Candidatus Woesearchaeota archaeon]